MNQTIKKLSLRFFLLVLCVAVLCAITSCGSTGEFKAVPLTDEEKELIELVKDDINVITDDNYAVTVDEFISHPGEYSGKLYQLEGVYLVEDGVSYITRTLVHDGEKTVAKLPLIDPEKELENGSWISAMGVMSTIELNGEEASALDVFAIEGFSEKGNEELSWSGSAHSH